MEGVRVEIKFCMKDLGLVLDSRWCFKEHFCRLVPRLRVAVSNFGRLLPNLGGPRDRVRCLYMGMAASIALYWPPCGPTVWPPTRAALDCSMRSKGGWQSDSHGDIAPSPMRRRARWRRLHHGYSWRRCMRVCMRGALHSAMGVQSSTLEWPKP